MNNSTFETSAYGGVGWSGRKTSHKDEIGTLWSSYAIDSEWKPLKAILLHRPGEELERSHDPDAVNMLAPLDLSLAQEQHDAMAELYRSNGVNVHYVDPKNTPRPNQMFCADQVLLTPQGAILARPASSVRAGEEREVARRLADLGVPILTTLTGTATFEGADGMWLDETTLMIGIGLRTNREGAQQITAKMEEIGIKTICADLPFGTMHFMGMLRIVDKDLAIAWPERTPYSVVMALREHGYKVAFLPLDETSDINTGINIVTLSPRKVVMVEGITQIQKFYESLGIECVTAPAHELVKAAGAFGCLTGVLSRDRGK